MENWTNCSCLNRTWLVHGGKVDGNVYFLWVVDSSQVIMGVSRHQQGFLYKDLCKLIKIYTQQSLECLGTPTLRNCFSDSHLIQHTIWMSSVDISFQTFFRFTYFKPYLIWIVNSSSVFKWRTVWPSTW